ncbi:MAG: hypothetical protein ACOC2W_02450 [bacterium]
MNNYNKRLVENKTNKQNNKSYIAYLLLFDANDILERKKLLKIIIKNPDIAVLFAKNCNPNNEEIAIITKSILSDIDACSKFIIECNLEGDIRKKVFNEILKDADISYNVAESKSLYKNELQMIYNKYNDVYIKTSNYNSYISYCLLFKDYISIFEKELLVDLICNYIDKDKAIKIMKNIKLNQELKDKLDSVLIIDTLSGGK